jgi:hypothetical protein
MKLNLSSIKTWIISYIQIQIFIMIVSMPILIYWGLPISCMSLVSNLIFNPFLILFLLVGSLIFFSELLYIPNQWLLSTLEIITRLWEIILKQGSNTWLIGFAKPSALFCLALICVAFCLLHAKKLSNQKWSIIWLSLLLFATSSYLKLFTKNTPKSFTLECNNGAITVIESNNNIIIIDPGVIGQRSSTASWLEYTLLSELNKRFGVSKIDHLILMQPGKLVFEHIEHLCHCTRIKKLYLVYWEGIADKRLLQRYGALRRALEETNTDFKRIGSHQESLKLGCSDYLDITPLPAKLSYNSLSFPVLHIHGVINNKRIDIYSNKAKKINKQTVTD